MHTCAHESQVGRLRRHVEADRRAQRAATSPENKHVVPSHRRIERRHAGATCHMHAHTHILILYNSTLALCNCRVAERARQATPPRNQGLLEATRTAFFFPLPLSTHILLLQSASFTFIIFFFLLSHRS